jgi:beta-phosphoglucomutase
VSTMASDVAFIWDIDGVVLDSPHEEAWRLTVMKEPWNADGLSSDFYFTHVASRPRFEGANNILELLGVYERLGATTDGEKRELMHEYAAEKDALIKDLIEQGEFKLFPDAVALLLKARRAGILQAAASASKNAAPMLRNVPRSRVLREVADDFGALAEGETLYSVFDFDACGIDVGGKEEILKYAADGLAALPGVEIDGIFVFEDAPSGVEAAMSLGYHAIGVLRIGEWEALEEAGAEIVTANLETVEVKDLLGLGT